MKRVTVKREAQMTEGHKLDAAIAVNLEELGWGG